MSLCKNLFNTFIEYLDIKDIMKGNKYIPLWYDNTCYNFPTAKVLYGLDETKEAIKKYQRILIYEGEKSVYKTQKYLGNKNYSVAMFGSKLSHTHKKIILDFCLLMTMNYMM